jgi:hypothetical protein
MIESNKIDSPEEQGYYIARRKSWARGMPVAVVRVVRSGTAGPFQVFQCADERASTIEEWDWSERIYV